MSNCTLCIGEFIFFKVIEKRTRLVSRSVYHSLSFRLGRFTRGERHGFSVVISDKDKKLEEQQAEQTIAASKFFYVQMYKIDTYKFLFRFCFNVLFSVDNCIHKCPTNTFDDFLRVISNTFSS